MESSWDFDKKNARIVAYIPEITKEEQSKIKDGLARVQPAKFIIYTMEAEKEKLLSLGFSLEAKMSGFFRGKTALIFTKYFDEKRATSNTKKHNKEVLTLVTHDKKDQSSIDIDYEVEPVKDDDLVELASHFRKVFPVYPTNIFDPDYLKKAKESDYLYIVAKDEAGKIVGAASAMKTGYKSAEITDCAVNPDYRGQGILQRIIIELEKELVKQNIFYSFSITRAKSVGMNMTIKRLGYEYEGTLTNNCIISTGYEDMNIWTKKLSDKKSG